MILYYRPPHYTLADEEYLDLTLRCLSSLMHNTGSQVILMGNFNLPNVDWIHYSAPANRFYDKFLNFINESGLLQYVLEPILDLLLTNDSNLITGLQVECPFSTSDHNVIRFSVNVNHDRSLLLDNYSVSKFYRDFSSADYDYGWCHI